MSKLGVTILIAVLLTMSLLTLAGADDYAIPWYSVNSGSGETSGGGYILISSVGQTAYGTRNSVDFLHWAGFWSGEIPAPQVVANTAAAKLLPDGVFVSVSGNITTSAAGDFGNFFYIQNENKSSGIRVAAAPAGTANLVRGSVVNVFGVLSATSDGERQLVGPIVIVAANHQPLSPVGMNNGAVGGGNLGILPDCQLGVTDDRGNSSFGINNVGLLIKTWGRVTASGLGYVTIDDGSNAPVRVDTSTLSTIPAINDYITVIGISSLHKSGNARFRTILPRVQSDIN